MLERCEIERERLAVVERGALALLRDRVARQVDPHESDGDSFIPVKMAAERLGLDVKTIYRRRLPFIRELVPGTWRVSTRALARPGWPRDADWTQAERDAAAYNATTVPL